MLKNIVIRTLSGAVYVVLIVVAIMLLDHSPIVFLTVFSLFIVLGIKEVYSMIHHDGNSSWLIMLIDMAGGVGLFLSMYMVMNSDQFTRGMWLMAPSAYLLTRCIAQLYRSRQNAVMSLQRSFFSILYVALPIALLNCIIGLSAPKLLLAVFIFIWINDTGAFLAGVSLGKHRLWERISPKKSWEGFFGGLLACMVAAWCFYQWLNEFFQPPQLGLWIGLSALVSIVATYGDLTESLLKRTEGVKDSGHLIPGHGGILDRIDSLLLVAPAVVIYLILIIYN